MQILTYFSFLARRGHEAAATAALQAQEMSRSPAKISSCSMRAAHKAEATTLPPRQQDHNQLVQQCLLWLTSTWKPSALPVQQANHARKILKEKNREPEEFHSAAPPPEEVSHSYYASWGCQTRSLCWSIYPRATDLQGQSGKSVAFSRFSPQSPVSLVTATRSEIEPVAFTHNSPNRTFHLRRFEFSVHL